jgi:hypothetical protein
MFVRGQKLIVDVNATHGLQIHQYSHPLADDIHSRYISSGFSGSTKLGNLGHVFYHVVFKSHVITSTFNRTLLRHRYPITAFPTFHVVRFCFVASPKHLVPFCFALDLPELVKHHSDCL